MNHHTEDMQLAVNSVSSFIAMHIQHARNTCTLLFMQADLKQTLLNLKKKKSKIKF